MMEHVLHTHRLKRYQRTFQIRTTLISFFPSIKKDFYCLFFLRAKRVTWSSGASSAHPGSERPSGAAAAAGCAPRCRRTGAALEESPGPAGSSASWLQPDGSAYESAAPVLDPLLLNPGSRSPRGSPGVREAVGPTGPAQPTGSGPPSQTGSPLHPAPNETEDDLLNCFTTRI